MGRRGSTALPPFWKPRRLTVPILRPPRSEERAVMRWLRFASSTSPAASVVSGSPSSESARGAYSPATGSASAGRPKPPTSAKLRMATSIPWRWPTSPSSNSSAAAFPASPSSSRANSEISFRGGSEEIRHPARPTSPAIEWGDLQTGQNFVPATAAEKNSGAACSKRRSTFRRG